MAGVSPQLIDLRKRIGDRIERMTKALEQKRSLLKAAQEDLAAREIEVEIIAHYLAEDKALLNDAAPKVRRQKKAPKTLGQQAGMDATEGVQP